MQVIRGEPVEVWLRDDRPARFGWRGRMYTVIFVVDRRPERAEPVGAEPSAPSVSDADGRECWLVEATPERALTPTRYELCHDLPSDRWSLSRG